MPFGTKRSDLVSLVEDDSRPLDPMENSVTLILLLTFVHNDRIRCDDNVERQQVLVVLCAICPIKHTNQKTRGKLGHLLLPLIHDGLWDNDESPRLCVGDHGCDELDSLSETHLITKKTTFGTLCCELTLKEPLNPLTLVRNDEATFE